MKEVQDITQHWVSLDKITDPADMIRHRIL